MSSNELKHSHRVDVNENWNILNDANCAIVSRWSIVPDLPEDEPTKFDDGCDDSIRVGCKFRVEGIDYDFQALKKKWQHVDEKAIPDNTDDGHRLRIPIRMIDYLRH
jgi:hypothetical protein